MPAFMMISGFLFYLTSWNKRPLTVFKKKIGQLFVPIISWNALGYLTIYLPLHYRELTSIGSVLKSFADFCTLWFLVSVFINSVFALVIRVICDRLKCLSNMYSKVWFQLGLLLFTMILGMVIPTAGQYTFMLPCFYFGFILARFNINIFDESRNSVIRITLSALFFALIPFYSVEAYVYTTGVYVTSVEQILVDLYRWFIGICGTCLLIELLKKARCVKLVGCKKLALLGQNTLPIYAIQSLCFTSLFYPFGKIVGEYINYSSMLVNVISVAVTIPALFFMLKISNWFNKSIILRYTFLGGR